MSSHPRILDWALCYNVRDLGGLPTVDGCVTRMRAIIRGDLPARLTETGLQRLHEFGICTILDLRKPVQVAEEPSIFMETDGDPTRPTYINISLEDHDAIIDQQISQAGRDRVRVYSLMLDNNQPQIAQIMQAIADAPSGGILIHCNAGKDRTGLISALLLGLVGVPDKIIADDYALSEAALWPLYEQLVAEAGGEAYVGWWLKPVAKPATMLATLTYLRMQYGSISGYLQSCGLTPNTLERVQVRLLNKQLT